MKTNTTAGTAPIHLGQTEPGKDVKDLRAGIEALVDKSKEKEVKTPPGKTIGQFKIFFGIDASKTLLLQQSKSGQLSLYTADFGIHPGAKGHMGLFGTTFQHVGDLGMPVIADKNFDHRAKAYAPFGKKDSTGKPTGFEIAMTKNGQLFVEKPNVNSNHVLLEVMPPHAKGAA
ncbi:MAG: hypothetical protein U1E65_00060 [Myxococcota bacterium]